MRLLGRRPGTNVNTVARELGLQPSNVSASIRSLVDRGLVERRSIPSDGRQVLLFLTAVARASRDRRERLWGEELASSWGSWTRRSAPTWWPPSRPCATWPNSSPRLRTRRSDRDPRPGQRMPKSWAAWTRNHTPKTRHTVITITRLCSVSQAPSRSSSRADRPGTTSVAAIISSSGSTATTA